MFTPESVEISPQFPAVNYPFTRITLLISRVWEMSIAVKTASVVSDGDDALAQGIFE